jgi:NAD-dependent deacetylase
VEIEHCRDVIIVIGTSSVVYPAASLPEMAKSQGATVIEVNVDNNTPLSKLADIFIQVKRDMLQID